MVWVDYMRTLSNPSSAKTDDLLHLQNTPLLKPTTDCPIIAKGAVMVANCNRQDRYLLPVWESAHLAAARAYSKPGMGMGLRLNESMTHHPPLRWRPLCLWIWVRPWVIAQQVIIGPLVDARTVAMTQNTGSDTFIVCSPRLNAAQCWKDTAPKKARVRRREVDGRVKMEMWAHWKSSRWVAEPQTWLPAVCSDQLVTPSGWPVSKPPWMNSHFQTNQDFLSTFCFSRRHISRDIVDTIAGRSCPAFS